MKRIKSTNILIIISTIIILGIIYNLIYLYNHTDNFDYWTIFWTCIGSLAVPGSLFGAIWKYQIDSTNKYDVSIKEIISELYPKLISVNKKYSSDKSEENKLILFQLSFEILSKMDLLSETFNAKENETMNLYKENIITILCPYKDDLMKTYNNDELFSTFFDATKNDDTPDDVSKDIKQNIENPFKTENDSVVIVKTHGSSKKDVIGDWKIAQNRAENLKYIIGIQIKDDGSKGYIGTFKIKKAILIPGNRYRFKTSIFKFNINDDFKEYLLDRLNIWTSANPVRYLDGL